MACVSGTLLYTTSTATPFQSSQASYPPHHSPPTPLLSNIEKFFTEPSNRDPTRCLGWIETGAAAAEFVYTFFTPTIDALRPPKSPTAPPLLVLCHSARSPLHSTQNLCFPLHITLCNMDVLINAKLTYELLLLELNSGSHSPSTAVEEANMPERLSPSLTALISLVSLSLNFDIRVPFRLPPVTTFSHAGDTIHHHFDKKSIPETTQRDGRLGMEQLAQLAQTLSRRVDLTRQLCCSRPSESTEYYPLYSRLNGRAA
ncbi:hypothetical protein DAPPUDRAFT_259747 [Daphnia pulex]|uniref:Uncharacterized protein n=1 Tax=Daphnia pulex TaxID=6669 RepID=E9HHS8_DAPPU|nr:hypothetical protein DAPPUDRAFT_259747 [Daphnia pulex]|eukprot:EFX68686.1 hypothetical protein DAPPUDRAFT_259747 [Daphnia pulex]